MRIPSLLLLLLSACTTEVRLDPGDDPIGVCGDGIVDPGERCDDGNDIDTDACTTACDEARCGDGFVHDGVEACDDGNVDNRDACLSSCEPARCGDGVVQEGVEACDEGLDNGVDGSTCFLDCRVAELSLTGTSAPADPIYGLYHAPTEIHAGDLDGDGTPDLMVRAAYGEFGTALVRALNDGAGTLWTPRVDSSDSFSGLIRVADFDSDGHDDAMTGAYRDDALAINLGTDLGIESARLASTTDTPFGGETEGVGPVEYLLSEMSGDADVDVAVFARTTNQLVFLESDGNGGFDHRHTIDLPLTGHWRNLLSGDVTGDGRDDLVFFQWNDTIAALWPRDTPENFTMRIFGEPSLGKSVGIVDYTAGLFDVDLDGDLEAVGLQDFDTPVLGVLDWDGTQLAPTRTTLSLSDGNRDCMFSYLYYTPPQRIDIDGDGIDEMLLDCDETVGVLRHGSRVGEFDFEMMDCDGCGEVYSQTPEVAGMQIADADADGFLDLVVLWRAGEIGVWWGDASHRFSGEPERFLVDRAVQAGWAEDMSLGDVTGDGLLDILLETSPYHGVQVLPALPGRRWMNPGALSVTSYLQASSTLDVDGDGVYEPIGIVDYWAGSSGDPEVDDAWITSGLNHRGRTEVHDTMLGVDIGIGSIVGTHVTGLATGDLDEDGLDDAVVISDDDDRVTVWQSDGTGSFTFFDTFPTTQTGTRHAWLADLDEDGHLDLVALDPEDAVISMRRGRGDGTFDPPAFASAGDPAHGPVSVHPADLNHDGVSELVVVAPTGGTVLLLTATAPFAYGDPVVLDTVADPVAVDVGDLNQDGLLDLAVVSASDELELRLGFGNGALSAPFTFATGASPRDVVLVDLDGDGRDDAVTANADSDDLTVLRSTLP